MKYMTREELRDFQAMLIEFNLKNLRNEELYYSKMGNRDDAANEELTKIYVCQGAIDSLLQYIEESYNFD